MPPCSISSPEKMKKGMARNENTFIPETIIWIGVASGRPSTANVARHARPMANATGTPSTRKSTKLRQRTLSSTDSVVVRTKNELEQALDAEQADQHAGDDRRQIAEGLGDAERGNRVVAGRLGHVQAAPEQQRGEGENEHVDDAAHPALRARRQQTDDRVESDVAGIADAGRSTEHRHRDHHQQSDLLDVRLGIVEDVAQHDAVDDDAAEHGQADAGDDQHPLGQAGADGGQQVQVGSALVYLTLTMLCSSDFSSGVEANLSQTGFSTSTKLFLSICDASMIFAPPLRTAARASFSLASQSLT